MRSAAVPLLLVAAAVVAGAGVGCPKGTPPHPPAQACLVAIDCYFGTDPPNSPGDHQLGLIIPGLRDTALFVNTYGATGSCWYGDEALAHACEDRCRGLLWQDCHQSYTDGGDKPFCKEFNDAGVSRACDFPQQCQDGNDTQCPEPNPHCVLPPNSKFGCCLIDGHDVSACGYEYDDIKDCRKPSGNLTGEGCPGAPAGEGEGEGEGSAGP